MGALVITSRIHVALPCVAFGTPVIFVKHKRLAGGYSGKSDRVDSTMMGLFHTFDFIKNKTLSTSRFTKSSQHWRNPNSLELRRVRANLLKRVCRLPYLAEYFSMFASGDDMLDMRAGGCILE